MRISKTTRDAFFATAFSAPLVAMAVLPAWSQNAPVQTVSISNFTFDPPTLTVKAGARVTWANRDDIPHGIAWTKNTFKRSQALDTNDSVSFTFATPGVYEYFCYLHPKMVGKIVVEAATGAAEPRP